MDLKDIPIILIAGPTGVGKTALINYSLEKESRFIRPIAYTTRAKRVGEEHGQFKYVSREQILEMHGKGQLVQLDEVHKELYAMDKSSIIEEAQKGKILIKEFHINDHRTIKSVLQNSISLVILPADSKTLARRVLEQKDQNRQKRIKADIKQHSPREILLNNEIDIVLFNDFSTPIDTLYKEMKVKLAQIKPQYLA